MLAGRRYELLEKLVALGYRTFIFGTRQQLVKLPGISTVCKNFYGLRGSMVNIRKGGGAIFSMLVQ